MHWPKFINEILWEFLDDFATAYLDDNLIYSNSLIENQEHIQEVLKALQNARWYLYRQKCKSHTKSRKYLSLIISGDGFSMDSTKIQTILECVTPKNVKDVQFFLSFANFYWKFILNYSRPASPLTVLTKKEKVFEWRKEYPIAFERLK